MTIDATLQSASIGAADANIFLCPSCTRPLAVGVSRCAGCGTRLVSGVQLVKVGGFVGLGLAAGLVVGGGVVGAITAVDRPVDAPVAQPRRPSSHRLPRYRPWRRHRSSRSFHRRPCPPSASRPS